MGRRVEAPGDGTGDEGGAFLLKQLDQPLLSGHQTIDLRRLAVEEVSDSMLLALVGKQDEKVTHVGGRYGIVCTSCRYGIQERSHGHDFVEAK